MRPLMVLLFGFLSLIVWASLPPDRSDLSDASASMGELRVNASRVGSAVRHCVMAYPATGIGTDPEWPAVPASSLVADLECPGFGGSDKRIWGGPVGAFRGLPKPPAGFGPWLYRRDSSGIRVEIALAGTDLRAREALCTLAENRFGSGEATADLSSPSSATLAVWLKRYSAPSSSICSR